MSVTRAICMAMKIRYIFSIDTEMQLIILNFVLFHFRVFNCTN